MKRSFAKFAAFAPLVIGAALGAAAAAAPQKAAAPATPAAPAAARKTWVDDLKYPPLNPIENPDVVRATLPNGMKLLLIEDHELPHVGFRMMIHGGRLAAPADKPALAELAGETLRTGGAGRLTGDALDEKLERIGASIESSVGADSASVEGATLTENLDEVLALFADVAMRPAFAQDKIDLAKTHMRSGISRRNDEVNGLARREFQKLLFGAHSPYVGQYEYADVDAVGRGDLVAYHAKVYRPDEAIFAAWGDFKAAEMKEKVAKLFAGWNGRGPAPVYKAPTTPEPAPSINYVEKKDVQQTFILAGHVGMRYDDPDYPATQVLSEILGGGFSSRLFVNVRTLKGLAYGAGGWMAPAYDHPGIFVFYTSTKMNTTAEALATVLDEIKKIREAPVSDAELKRAKDGFLNSYVFEYDSKSKIVNRLVTYEFYGYPADFNVRLKDAIEKVTKEDVLRVAKTRLLPEKLLILAAGNAEQFDKPLSTFGKVNTIDVTIPEPKAAEVIPPATPESLAEGLRLMKFAAQAKGAGLAAVKDIVAEGTLTMQTPMGAMDLKAKQLFVLPDKYRMELTTPMGAIVMVVSGQAGFQQAGGQTMDLPASAVAEMAGGLPTEFGALLLVRDAADGKINAQALGPAKFEDQDAEQVLVTLNDKPMRLFIAKDGTVLGTKHQGKTQEGPAELVEVFGAPTTDGGVAVPAEGRQTANGKPASSYKLTTVKVNGGVDPKLFAK